MLRRELFEFIQGNGGVNKVTIETILAYLDEKRGEQLSGDELSQCKSYLRKLLHKIRCDWAKAGRHLQRYIIQQEKWLKVALDNRIISCRDTDKPSTPIRSEPCSTAPCDPSTSAKRGRPFKPFSELKSSAKRSSTSSLSRHTSDKLLHAAKRRARSEGRKDLSFVLKESVATPTRPTKVRRLLQRQASPPRMSKTNEALAVFIDGRHTKR